MAKGQWRAAYRDLPFKDALKKAQSARANGHKAMLHKDPNRRFEVWLWAPGQRRL